MTCYDFRLILEIPPDVADDPSGERMDDLSNQLYEAGCDDGSLGKRCGVWDITLHREADDISDAIQTAIKQVEGVGCRVVRVESPDQYQFDRVNEELATRGETAVVTDH